MEINFAGKILFRSLHKPLREQRNTAKPTVFQIVCLSKQLVRKSLLGNSTELNVDNIFLIFNI